VSRGRPLLAALLALSLLTAAPATDAKPRPRPAAKQAMSAVVPYVAPWESGFARFSTQLLKAVSASASTYGVVVAQGQWWRIVYIYHGYNLGATAGNRQMRLRVLTPNSGPGYEIAAAGVAPASSVYRTLWGPALTAFTQAGFVPAVQAVQTIPDLLWPPGSTIDLILDNYQAGDGNPFSSSAIAVEVYTPVKDKPGVFTPLPLVP